ncbi:hypothetical protein [Pontibacillus yanchengensis]|uniref:Uncharacterized protein n=2 Tax=Pontibacillus yanchengensis TaxID=462910 RepID=A0A6I4ZPS4_9BACI|nr:hypothetical protein [Pontibacillus yanchengensis]MYL32188.1 hypothetical protein [Pontibacillus yanchengensis]
MVPAHVREKLSLYSYMIKRGKPAASMAIQSRYVEDVRELLAQLSVSYTLQPLTDDWYTLWMYKHPHILDIIAQLPQAPKTSFDHWVLGKLYGYDEASISEFLVKLDRSP